MTTKVITLKGNKEEQFIKLMASRFGVFAENELKLIGIFVKYDMFTPFYLDKHTRLKLGNELNVPYPSFTNSLRRLVAAGIFAKQGKTLYFNTAFRNLSELDQICFRFKAE